MAAACFPARPSADHIRALRKWYSSIRACFELPPKLGPSLAPRRRRPKEGAAGRRAIHSLMVEEFDCGCLTDRR
jgi:hypothetical protein